MMLWVSNLGWALLGGSPELGSLLSVVSCGAAGMPWSSSCASHPAVGYPRLAVMAVAQRQCKCVIPPEA